MGKKRKDGGEDDTVRAREADTITVTRVIEVREEKGAEADDKLKKRGELR